MNPRTASKSKKPTRTAKTLMERALRELDAELTGPGGTSFPQGTGKRCKVCSRGIIMAETRLVLDGTPVLSNGPGTKQPLYRRVTSYHCGECKVMYASLPRS